MRNFLVPLCIPCALLVLACGGKEAAGSGDAAPGADTKAAAESAGGAAEKAIVGAEATVAAAFPSDFGKKPCELLTPAMVAKVAKVDEAAVSSQVIAGMCLYEWEGGKAKIAFVRVYDSAEVGAEIWENGHKSMSSEDVKAAFKQIGDATEKKLEADAKAGDAKVDPKLAKPVVGAMGAGLTGGIQWERVEGLGDAAAYESTRHEYKIMDQTIVSYANKMDVRLGNLSFDVSFSLEEPEPKQYKDENIALAREVLGGLGG